MKRKIVINKSYNGGISGRLNIPEKLLEIMGITEDHRDVVIQLQGNKLVIEKMENNQKNLAEKVYVEVTKEERECLF